MDENVSLTIRSIMKLLVAVGILLCITQILGAPGVNDYGERIIGSDLAELNQFPSLARLRITRRDESVKHCAGSFISDRFLLTSAFCLVNATVVQVRAGHTRNSKMTFITNTTRFIQHEMFSISDRHNDIGIVDLETPAPISENLSPVPIAGRSLVSNTMEGENATVAGWGTISDDLVGMMEFLRYITMGIISNNECERYLDSNITPASICGNGLNDLSQGICHGDEGAPLLWEDKDGQIIQIGVASTWAVKCEDQGPSAFVRPHHYWQWISDWTGIPIRE